MAKKLGDPGNVEIPTYTCVHITPKVCNFIPCSNEQPGGCEVVEAPWSILCNNLWCGKLQKCVVGRLPELANNCSMSQYNMWYLAVQENESLLTSRVCSLSEIARARRSDEFGDVLLVTHYSTWCRLFIFGFFLGVDLPLMHAAHLWEGVETDP